jgi:hypothetical protein
MATLAESSSRLHYGLPRQPVAPGEGRLLPASACFHLPDDELNARASEALLVHGELPIERVVAALGNGSRVSAQDTVPLVLWCAARHPGNYEAALWLTVSALGDRDTTCAMVGGIIACRVGRAGLPQEWLSRREALPTLNLG